MLESKDIILKTGESLHSLTIVMHSKFVNFHAISKSCEVPQSYIRVLFILKKDKEKTMSEMARFMNVSKPNLTPVIDRLIMDGYVERKPGQKDRRKLLISLTGEGLKYLDEVKSIVKAYTASKLEGLSLQDLQELNEASDKIVEIMKKLET